MPSARHRLVLSALALALVSPADAALVEQCAWTGSPVVPASNQVTSTPVVADLDRDGVPDVVFVSYEPSGGSWDGVLRAISGADCSELFSVADVGCRACFGQTACSDLDTNAQPGILGSLHGLAVGDIDGDGEVEIVAGLADGAASSVPRLVAFEADGSFKWCSEAVRDEVWIHPSLADLDLDGTPEIVVGSDAFGADGRLLWQYEDLGTMAVTSLVANLDGIGPPEVVVGAVALRSNGTVLWRRADLATTFRLNGAGVADFDADGFPEIVVADTLDGDLHVLDGLTGVTEAAGPLPAPAAPCPGRIARGYAGGHPAIGDVDGDGTPEIALSTWTSLCLYEYAPGALSQRWCRAIEDCSSGRLAPAMADTDGDGLLDVIFRDEVRLLVLRGSDGFVMADVPSTSITAFEGPVAADVDGDCAGEVIVSADDQLGPGQHGVRIFGEDARPFPSWRAIWNQASYHVTNVEDDGTIPAAEPPSWVVPNSYLAQVEGSTGAAVDVSLARPSLSELWPPNHRFVRVAIDGVVDAAGSPAPVRVTRVTQDEPLDAEGDGSTQPDAVLDGDGVLLRAERQGPGDGRVYHVEFEAGSGACVATGSVTVCVPHDQRPDHACVDQGELFDSTTP